MRDFWGSFFNRLISARFVALQSKAMERKYIRKRAAGQRLAQVTQLSLCSEQIEGSCGLKPPQSFIRAQAF